jgi:hypothetical protein
MRRLLILFCAAVIPVVAAPTQQDVLGIAKKHYEKASAQMENDLRPTFSRLVNWRVTFDGTGVDPKAASRFSAGAAFLVGNTKARNFYLGYAAAAFSLDPANAAGAGNLASAIATYGDDIPRVTPAQMKPYRDDALTVYLYAVSLPGAAGRAGIPSIVNLGHLYLDAGLLAEARAQFEEAVRRDFHSWPAHAGMVAYYLAKGDKAKADEEAKKREYFPASIRRRKELADKTDEKRSPTVAAGDSEGDMMTKIAQLHAVEPASSADFLQELDQSEANRLRSFIRNIEAKMVYQAPDIKTIMQYGTLEAFSQAKARADYDDWMSEWKDKNATPLAIKQAGAQVDALKKLGVDIGVDMAKLAKDPDYYNREGAPEISVKGLDEFAARMDAMAKKLEKGGSLQEQMKIVQEVDQSVNTGQSILNVRAYDYANPMDIYIQQFNIVELNKKIIAYQMYLRKVLKRISPQLDQMKAQRDKDLAILRDARKRAVERVDQSNDLSIEAALLRRHAVHVEYDHQLNEVSSHSWAQTTLIANVTYLRELKPNIEAMYADCMRHVMMISDPDVRAMQENVVLTSVLAFVNDSMTQVLKGYEGEYLEPWACECDIDALVEAREADQKAYDAAAEAARKKNKAARADFRKGVIPETSKLYQQIDKYSATLDFFVMQIKVGVLKSELKYRIPLKGKVGGPTGEISLGFVFDHMRETTTITGGLEAGAKLQTASEGASLAGKVWTNVVLTLDNEMVVRDFDWAAGASVTGTIGTGKMSDVGSAALQGTVAYETSVMRGSKFTAEVAAVASTDVDWARPPELKELKKTTGLGLGLKEQAKYPVWKGTYQF